MNERPAIVELSHVHKQFHKKTVIKDVSFQISYGQIYGLLGPNGAGKTTTIQMLTGLMKPDRGAIYVNGSDVIHHSLRIRSHMGIVPDADELLDDLTCLEFLQFIGSIRNIPKNTLNDRIKEWLTIFHLWEHRKFLLGSYSHGMRKKVQFIASVLHQPKLLIIDEPTNGLDPDMMILLRDLLLHLKAKGVSVLVSTHHLSFAENVCDQVCLIKDGTVCKDGFISDILRDTHTSSLESAYANLSNSSSEGDKINDLLTNW
ncbi:ABC transporter ATP-binding protein [Gracilibacillus halophilus]|nr:ABC transporter ATP-binding protein [Gracilibacillus halophilus]